MNPDEYCQQQVARSGSSLYASLLFTGPDKRSAIIAVHAFNQAVQTVIDTCSETAIARTRLDWWRQELANCYAGNPRHPISEALQAPLQRYDLAQEYFSEMLDAADMDLEPVAYPTFRELGLYCYRSSGVTSLLCSDILGYEQRATAQFAGTLGTALSLVRLLRNVRQHSHAGRLYLPEDLLDAHGLSPQDLQTTTSSDKHRALFRQVSEQARQFFQEAETQLPDIDRYRQHPALIQSAIARTLLNEIEADGFHLLEHRIKLTPFRKLWIAWHTHRRSK